MQDFLADPERYLLEHNPLLSAQVYMSDSAVSAEPELEDQLSVYGASKVTAAARKRETTIQQWSEEDDGFLRTHYRERGSQWVSRQLHRSRSSCVTRARELGLRLPNSWRPEEDAFLREHFEEKGSAWVGERLNRTASACAHRAARLQVWKTKKFKKWSEEEDAFLIANYKRIPTEKIAATLSRTMDSCWMRARNLGLNTKRNKNTAAE